MDSWLKLNEKTKAVKKLEFQNGLKGPTGNYYRDARTRRIFSSPEKSDGNEEGGRFVADANAAGDPIIQTFLAFNNIFGSDATQIPLGAKIKSATLLVTVTNPGGVPALYPMGVEWNFSRLSFDDAMFNGNTEPGIQTDNKEALSAPKAPPPHGRKGEVEIDVTSSVQSWSSGARNFGWLLTTKSSNAWGAHGLDVSRSIRPKFVVEFEGEVTE